MKKNRNAIMSFISAALLAIAAVFEFIGGSKMGYISIFLALYFVWQGFSFIRGGNEKMDGK